MTSTLRRAGGFAAVGTLSLAAPALGVAAAAPFAAIALLAAFVITDGPLFELFARPGDREDGRLNGLASVSLAVTGLALLATVPREPMPLTVFVATVVGVTYGNLGGQLVTARREGPFVTVAGFAALGFPAAVAGQAVVAVVADAADPSALADAAPDFVFVAAVVTLVAALVRSALYERDDPVVLLSTGILAWVFGALVPSVGAVEIALALAVTVALGYASYALGTASVTGMLTGVILGLLTVVLGSFGWFVVLIAFFSVGGLSTKFRYEEKLDRGVAEDNDGARGSSNVLGNAAVAFAAVVGFAAASRFSLGTAVSAAFGFAFAGSLAAAMSDTLSSEIGGLYDRPRLITTLEPVAPGTDGGVTWQGEVAGVVGAALVAGLALLLMPLPGPAMLVTATVVAGGVAGMTVDSLLGATLEGDRIGNEAVNLLATLAGALVSGGAALALLV
ncbi:DUF92 domain-containing protein [Salinigranum rubrum]|uniref:DUF92 domain-containing protein n=1 Tax=Salinigranum rubrum TaxID=755307 RepID=A0A2I8VMG4_9EURY|nr:DUF92 domain-containing protein [Salinigranum rubrum]AUV83085.1 DUF92 domain-containing protein [Salinigranum rubrum]